MGKQLKKSGPGSLPGWHDCSMEDFSPASVSAGAQDRLVVEYAASGAHAGSYQGTALCGQSTRRGGWVEGLHLAAMDAGFNPWATFLPSMNGTGPNLYHFCAETCCQARSSKSREAVHVA